MKRKLTYLVVVLSLAAFIPAVAAADSCVPAKRQDAYSRNLARKGEKRLKKAEAIFQSITSDAEKGMEEAQNNPGKLQKIKIADEVIPALLLEKAKCVVIIPGEKSIGFAGYGVDYGAGISLCRGSDGDLADAKPSFVKVKGGAFGPQIGGKSTDRILLFMNDNADRILKKPSLKLGADVAVAAGPFGRDIAAGTNLHLQDGVLSYSHSKGIYAGATLDGSVLQPDAKMNEAVAGMEVKRGFFGKIGHGLIGIFHHSKNDSVDQAANDCEATLAAAGAAAQVNVAVNPPAELPKAAVAANTEAQKPVAPVVVAAAPAAPACPAGQVDTPYGCAIPDAGVIN